MEDILTDLMFEAPSDPTIDKIIITEGVIKMVRLRKLLAKGIVTDKFRKIDSKRCKEASEAQHSVLIL